MVQVVRKITADVVKRGSTRAIYAKQNDLNSRFLSVQIQEEGVDIVVSDAAEVLLNVERSDKAKETFKGSVLEDGTVKVPLTTWMLELEGTLVCDISIVQADTAKLTTMKFNIYVEAAVVPDEVIVETEEYSVIVDLLARTSRAAEMAEEAAQNATLLKENCEEATAAAIEAANGTMPTIKEHNEGIPMSFWVGTREEYDAIEEKTVNRLYIIVNDNERDGVVARLNIIETALNSFNKVLYEDETGASDGILVEDFSEGKNYSLFAIKLGGHRTLLGYKEPDMGTTICRINFCTTRFDGDCKYEYYTSLYCDFDPGWPSAALRIAQNDCVVTGSRNETLHPNIIRIVGIM